MPPSSQFNPQDIIKRSHATGDKARNERQKAVLLQYLAELRWKLYAPVHAVTRQLHDAIRRKARERKAQ